MAIEQIKKGWLKTRDGFKYAPKTFTQNIIDTEYNKTLDKIISAQTTNINLIEKDLNEISQKVENIGIDGSEDKLYIVDKNDNIIAYFDNTGLHSINYYVGNSTNSEDSLSGIIEKLKNFDGSNSDKLYIIDNNDNVMAYFDASGIHSIDFLIEDQFGQSTKISKLISDINLLLEDVNSIESNLDNQNQRLKLAENELSYIDLPNNENVNNIALLSASLEDDKFFFTDKNDNVIAYVSDTGIHSVEFINKEGIILTNLNQELNTVIGDLNDANNAITNNLNSINLLNEKLKLAENELSYINLPTNENTNNTTLLSASSDDDKLYFIDKNDNVIAYIDNTGIHTVEIFNKEGITLTNLQSNINNVISDDEVLFFLHLDVDLNTCWHF